MSTTTFVRQTLAAAATLAVATAVTACDSPSRRQTLTASVGPAYEIALLSDGRPVRRVVRGRYRIVVSDRSAVLNFRLRGPRLDRTTSVAGVGTTTWEVKLVRGIYEYLCDPHKNVLRGAIRVD